MIENSNISIIPEMAVSSVDASLENTVWDGVSYVPRIRVLDGVLKIGRSQALQRAWSYWRSG
jgi:hypothetical protein